MHEFRFKLKISCSFQLFSFKSDAEAEPKIQLTLIHDELFAFS